jgi:hypothetical protein
MSLLLAVLGQRLERLLADDYAGGVVAQQHFVGGGRDEVAVAHLIRPHAVFDRVGLRAGAREAVCFRKRCTADVCRCLIAWLVCLLVHVAREGRKTSESVTTDR